MLEISNHKYGWIRQKLAVLLCLSLLAGNARFVAFADQNASGYLDGWRVQAFWSTLRTDYVWNAEEDSLRQPKAVITYRMENAKQTYDPGSLSFSIPGIGGSVRKETQKADYHSGEDAEWDCVWDPLTDRYTFTNLFTVKEGQSVSGGFELMWTFSARDCVDGYSREESPVFSVTDAGSISLEPLSYEFHSLPDRYRIHLYQDQISTSDYEKADKAYIWYELETRFDKDWLARGIYKSDYRITVEPEEESWQDIMVLRNGKEISLEAMEDGSRGFYLFRGRYGNLGSPDYTVYETFTIGFRKESLAGSSVTIKSHLDRLYEDQEIWTTTAGDKEVVDQELSFQVEDYSFTHSGYIYDHDKWNWAYENYDKEPGHYWHKYGDEKSHEEPADYTERLNGVNLYNGKLVEFALRGEANRNYASTWSARTAVASASNASPSNAVLDTETSDNSHIPEEIADWNDLHWRENQEVVQSFQDFSSPTYGELHPEYVGTASDAVRDEDMEESDEETDEWQETDLENDLEGSVASPSDLTDLSSAAMTFSLKNPTRPGGNTGVSQIQGEEAYSLVLGDDKLAIFLKDGTIRNLEDDEYDLAYVTIPTNGIQADYEIYGADTQDLHFDAYTLLEEGDTDAMRTYLLPEGVKSLFVRVNDLTISTSFQIYVGVRLHLDWEANQQQEESERPDHENRLVNFSYFRALYVDEEGYEVNDCAQSEENYQGTYGLELAERDEDTYQEYLLRDYSNVWLRSPVTALSSNITLDPFVSSGSGGFTSNVTAEGLIQADSPGELTSFSLYAVLPEGLIPVLEEGAVQADGLATGIYDGGSLEFAERVSYRLGERDGRTMLAADFDFSEYPLEISQETLAQICFPVNLSYEAFARLGSQYRVDAYLMVHDDGIDKISGEAILSDEFDMDDDGRTDDKMSYGSDLQVVLDQAFQWREYASKYVKSSYSDDFGSEAVVRIFEEDASQEIQEKSLYSYRLDFGLGSSNAKEIIFYDRIEQGASIAENEDTPDAYQQIPSAWQGTFLQVDTSYAEGMGLIPTVYYSGNEQQAFDLTAEGWESKLPSDPGNIKAIAVHLDTSGLEDGLLKTRQMVSVTIRMQAPKDSSLIGKRAVNQYQVQYDAYGLGNSYEKTYTLPSSETYVRLLDTVGTLILKKVDQDHPLRTDGQGTVQYAALAGAQFQIYDASGNALYESPRQVDATGSLEISGVPYGTYYWEEVLAPEGYEPISGLHSFSIDGREEILEIPNQRKEASVTLIKRDQDDPDGEALPGAIYELYDVSGEMICADEEYHYQKEGTLQRFVTGTDGTFTISGLPWGSYEVREVQAPAGYDLSEEPLSFTLGRYHLKQEIVGWNREKRAAVRLTKRDAADNRTLRDACYDLYRKQTDGTWKKIQEYQRTNAAGELLVEDLPFGLYEFRELQPPAGYEINPDPVSFVLDAATAETTVEVSHLDERKTGSVQLQKTAEDGMPLKGAEYSLFRSGDSNPVLERLVTGDDGCTPVVEELAWGDYYFQETAAPAGYQLDTAPVAFTVDAQNAGLCQTVTAQNLRMRGSVKLTKYDEATKNLPLAGAVFSLYKNDGTLIKDQLETGADGTLTVTELDWGSYYLEETKAPPSYGLSTEKLRFSINNETCQLIQSLVCYDPLEQVQLKINKQISEREEAFGNPTFLFRIEGEDVNHIYHKWIRSITLSGQMEGFVILTGIPAGTYTVEEIEVSRYKQLEILPVKNVVITDGKATADLTLESEAEVTFCNQLDQYEKYSHTANATNLVTAVTKLTGIRVSYLGPETIHSDTESSYTFTKEDLEVVAYYDDGTSAAVPFRDLTLNPETITGNQNTSGSGYTVEVIYRENGIQVSDFFSVEVSLQKPSIPHYIVYDANGGYFGEDPAKTLNQLQYLWNGSENQLQDGVYQEPEHLSKVFDGWYLDPACSSGKEYTFEANIPLEQDLTVYAKWKLPGAVLLNGSLLNQAMKRLTGADSTSTTASDQQITGILRSSISPDLTQMTVEVVSTPESEAPVYMWFDQDVIFWWSKAPSPKATNLAYACYGLASLVNIEGLEDWDVSSVTSMYSTFANCSALTQVDSLKDWDVSSVTDMSSLFLQCVSLENLDGVSGWNTGSLTRLSGLARRCETLASLEPFQNWDVSGVTSLSQTFSECTAITSLLPLQNWQVGNVTTFVQMFSKCSSLLSTEGLENWNTAKASSLRQMFYLCQKLSDLEGLRGWDVSGVTDLSGLFNACHNLTTLEPLTEWDVSSVINLDSTFHACSGLSDLQGLEKWKVSKVENMNLLFADCSGKLTNLDALKDWDVSSVTNMNTLFASSSLIASLDALEKWNVSSVTDFAGAFRNCKSLQNTSGIQDWPINPSADFTQMFYNCPSHPEFTKQAGSWDSEGTFQPETGEN